MVDTFTNVPEIIRINGKTSKHVTEQFSNTWLARYPKPNRCTTDNGGEFTGHEFQKMLALEGITHNRTTVKNPQANAVCERMHATMGSVLRTLTSGEMPTTVREAEQLVDNAIQRCVRALRCAINQTLKTSPGGLAFHRDMLIDVPLMANVDGIWSR